MTSYKIINNDCLKGLKKLKDNSIDACVCDPPYGLSFMGKKWDAEPPDVAIWREILRVLKPGGHLLAFGGTRTFHRLACHIEDAGFNIRDSLCWLYGQGFPKSSNISKGIEKTLTKTSQRKPKVIGYRKHSAKGIRVAEQRSHTAAGSFSGEERIEAVYELQTEEAKQWQGWGTALKPRWEPIILARKPLEKGMSIPKSVLKWSTGGLNIDDCRISTSESAEGRFPANVILECLCPVEGGGGVKHTNPECPCYMLDAPTKDKSKQIGASRFFYNAKAQKKEKNAGLHQVNTHPTVKPIALMRWLCRLVTPPGGLIIDPFMGSGSTGCAAMLEGFNFIGMEKEVEYCEIAEKRLEYWKGRNE